MRANQEGASRWVLSWDEPYDIGKFLIVHRVRELIGVSFVGKASYFLEMGHKVFDGDLMSRHADSSAVFQSNGFDIFF